jgi:hypothetical protein
MRRKIRTSCGDGSRPKDTSTIRIAEERRGCPGYAPERGNECVSECAASHPNCGTPQAGWPDGPVPPGPSSPDGKVIAVASSMENLPLSIVACPDCGWPAEILEWFSLTSTDGPVEHLALACVDGHYLRMPTDRLSAHTQRQLLADRIQTGEAQRDGAQSDRAAVACLTAGSGAQPSGLAISRLPGHLGTVGSTAAAGGVAAARLPAAARAGSAAAGTPRPPGSAH